MSLLDFDAKPDAYAVMGNPIAHSKSPRIHTLFAEQTRQRLTYTAILVDPGGFEQAVGNFQANGGKGLNVTVPFKQEAWRLVDTRSARAERARAVNTIALGSDGRRFGDNTDGVGLVNDLRRLGVTLNGRRVLILGAGGAVRGVLEPLLEEAPAELVIANRTVSRAEELARTFTDVGSVSGCGFDDLSTSRFDVVINGTAASLQGEVPPLPDDILAEDAACYDMMYAAEPTAFIQWAREHHAARSHDGLGMLVAQAAESFFIWRGVRPETTAVVEALRRELSGWG